MPLNTREGIALYTDGSSHCGDRSGGWAWIALDAFGNEETASGAIAGTTNNRMEMHAVLHGLGSLWKTYGPSDVLIRSDSQYVVLGASDSGRKRMKNVDYWEMIDAHVALHNCVVFEHVRGHSGDHYNDRVDKLAGTARKRGKC